MSLNRYGDKVEQYLDVYLRTPGLASEGISRAQLARGTARRLAAERLLAKAQQGLMVICFRHYRRSIQLLGVERYQTCI